MDVSTIALCLCIGSCVIMAVIMIRPFIIWYIEDIKESIKDKDYQYLAISILFILAVVFAIIAMLYKS